MINPLDEIQARADAATPGPWKLWGMTVMADPLGNSNVDESHDIAHSFDPDRGLRTFNADFIRAAREDVPKLVAALRAVEAVHCDSVGDCAVCVDECGCCPLDYPCPTITAIREALS